MVGVNLILFHILILAQNHIVCNINIFYANAVLFCFVFSMSENYSSKVWIWKDPEKRWINKVLDHIKLSSSSDNGKIKLILNLIYFFF